MAITVTTDTISTHATVSNDEPARRSGEPSQVTPKTVIENGAEAPSAPEPLDLAVQDPYDNIACTD